MFKIVLATFTFSMVLTSGSFAASVSCKQFVNFTAVLTRDFPDPARRRGEERF